MTTSSTTTFTRTNARYIASKIAADLRQMQLFYDKPTSSQINDYVEEVVEYLAAGYLKSVEYGFRKDGNWLVSLRYEVRYDGTLTDGAPGGVHPRADTTGASFYSFLSQNSSFSNLSSSAQDDFRGKLPIDRTPGQEPGHVNGYWVPGNTYASGGVGAGRKMWRPR
jgi:hypothetical protein